MENMESYTLPNSKFIKLFRSNDFALETKDKICIFEERYSLVLFYDETLESKKILSAFKVAAESVNDVVFGVCNLELETEVFESLTELKNDSDHPFNWVTSRPSPFIIVYRKGYPVYFYDGPPDSQILINFVINFARSLNFKIQNLEYLNQIKIYMWTEYSMRNPVQFEKNSAPIGKEILPAIPLSRYNK
jgi:hypothetical protein